MCIYIYIQNVRSLYVQWVIVAVVSTLTHRMKTSEEFSPITVFKWKYSNDDNK